MRKVVLIYSGGSDSYTLLHYLQHEAYDVHALTFDYGQRHRKEIECAIRESSRLNVPHAVVPLPSLHALAQGSNSALLGASDVPEGHYADTSMRRTVVPNRNMIMLALAAAHAIALEADAVAYGAHAGDHTIYPDCRPVFYQAMCATLGVCHYTPIELMTPFLYFNKSDIYRAGLSMGIDYAQTWSCYNGREKACGRCGACNERLEAFATNGYKDPLAYEVAQ